MFHMLGSVQRSSYAWLHASLLQALHHYLLERYPWSSCVPSVSQGVPEKTVSDQLFGGWSGRKGQNQFVSCVHEEFTGKFFLSQTTNH